MNGGHRQHRAVMRPAVMALGAVVALAIIVAINAVGPAGSIWGPDRILGAAPPVMVTGTSPEDGAENRPIDQVFQVSFDQDIDQATLAGALFMFKAGGTPLAATVTWDPATRTATLSPSAKLEPGSTYYVTLGVQVRSTAGAGVAGAPLIWHFHTVAPVPPHVAGHTPADGAVEQPLSQPITVTFDVPMDASSFTSTTFYYAKQGGLPLPAAIDYDPATMTATLIPADPLEEATTYEVSMTSGVRGATGLFVVGTPSVWRFTTVLVQPPAVAGHTPADGAEDQPLDVAVTVSFDRPMDPSTMTPDSLFLQKLSGDRVAAVLDYSDDVVTIAPTTHLDPDTTYLVVLTEAVKSAKGASVIGAPITWTFTTKHVALAFTDVPVSYPYFTAISRLAEREVIDGFNDGTFRPELPVLRQQFAKMIVRAMGYPVSEASLCPFTDVVRSEPGHFIDPGDPLYPDHYVAVAASHGIVLGKTSVLFAPYEYISRFQAVSMAVRAIDDIDRGLLMNPPAAYQATWNPALSPAHGQNARLAEFNGLLAGLPLAALDPIAPMTRGEIAQLEWNLLTFLGR